MFRAQLLGFAASFLTFTVTGGPSRLLRNIPFAVAFYRNLEVPLMNFTSILDASCARLGSAESSLPPSQVGMSEFDWPGGLS